jgi:hypothetical protein
MLPSSFSTLFRPVSKKPASTMTSLNVPTHFSLLACFLSLFAPRDSANPMTNNANKELSKQGLPEKTLSWLAGSAVSRNNSYVDEFNC